MPLKVTFVHISKIKKTKICMEKVSITEKLEQLGMGKFGHVLFMLKRSYICYYIICMTLPLKMVKKGSH